MNSYVVLARKWRPGQFSDIVGQGPVVRTLMNAVRAQRIHQAYLFTGSRGIGKTSIARIFAKVIRCEKTASAQNDWLKSCDECASCREITGGNGIDVIEIDGASNNGVEAVREIRENAKYMPSTGSRKIYIIDEVHMLTTQAFNALLKTLEEPPAHVIFIFATTEPHKIPATILSRCQRFDFRRVTVAQIQARIAEIARAEGIEAEPGALALIAQAAEGSMRDSLSLLDQVIAFSGSRITAATVRESVGLVEGQTLLAILSGIFKRKPLEALSAVDQAYQRGHDLRVLTRSLIEFLHAAILLRVGAANSVALELSDEERKELGQLAELRPLEEIELFFQVLHHGLEWIARSPQPKVVLDVLLVKCATAETLLQVQTPATLKPQATTAAATPLKTAALPALANGAPQPNSAMQPRNWEGLINHVRKPRPLLASILEHATCPSVPSSQGADLPIHFHSKDVYFRDQLQARVYSEQLSSLSKEYLGFPVRIALELKDEGESLAAKRERETQERETNARVAAQNHPIIMEAKSLFGGDLSPIEIPPSEREDD